MSESLFRQLASLLNLESLEGIEVAHYPLVQPDGNEHAPFLLVENRQLAVPIKALFAAYTVACDKMYSALPVEVWEATSILLLQTPEHLTALNARRRLLLASKDPDLNRELRYIQVLLSVPANSKAAALWHHRRWLLAWQLAGSPPRGLLHAQMFAGLSSAMLEHELSLASRACEIYPRNHSAWAHRAYMLAAAESSLLRDEIDATLLWLDRHIVDHSAASHLAVLARRTDLAKAREQACDLVQRYPERETPWALLRKVATLEEARHLVEQHLTGADQFAQMHALKAAIWWLYRDGRLQLSAHFGRAIASRERADEATVQELLALLKNEV